MSRDFQTYIFHLSNNPDYLKIGLNYFWCFVFISIICMSLSSCISYCIICVYTHLVFSLFIYLIINDLLKLLIHSGLKNINFCRVFGWTNEHLYCKTFFVSLNAPLLVITGVKKFKICTNSHEFTGILHLHVSVQK